MGRRLQRLLEKIDKCADKVDQAINESNEKDYQNYIEGNFFLSKKRRKQCHEEYLKKKFGKR